MLLVFTIWQTILLGEITATLLIFGYPFALWKTHSLHLRRTMLWDISPILFSIVQRCTEEAGKPYAEAEVQLTNELSPCFRERTPSYTYMCWANGRKKHTLPQSLDITCLTIWLHWWCICIFFSALPCILLLPGRFIEPGNLGCVSWSTLSPNKISWLRLTLSL